MGESFPTKFHSKLQRSGDKRTITREEVASPIIQASYIMTKFKTLQITRSSQTLGTIERLEGDSFWKISPFLASHSRHKRVCRMKGQSFASRWGGVLAFHISTSERVATLESLSLPQNPALIGHPKGLPQFVLWTENINTERQTWRFQISNLLPTSNLVLLHLNCYSIDYILSYITSKIHQITCNSYTSTSVPMYPCAM
jgi:hypothetical protein